MDQCMSLSSSFDPRYFRVCELDGMPHVSPPVRCARVREGVHGGGGEKVKEPVRGLDAIAEFINDDGGRDRNEHTIKRL